MASRDATIVVALLLGSSLLATTTTGRPPQPGEELNGLTPNESATLWSHDTDEYITQTKYEERFGEERSPMAQLANGTDITFTRPPRTAATWTQHDFQDLEPGNASTSVYPSHANRTNGTYIVDAHATLFAVQPSTRGHLDPQTSPLYVAPNGTVRSFIDYRIRGREANGTNWELLTHEIEEVRLLVDGEPIARTAGSHTPSIDYELDGNGQVTLTLEADIHVKLQPPNPTANRTGGNESIRTETVTVRDSIAVEIYDLHADAYAAEYPNGDFGVAIYQSQPWQGYTLTRDGEQRVRGVWRFYTARDTNWDELIYTNRTGTSRQDSEAIPVYVHAYPSRIGPRAEPVRDGPAIVETWGINRSTPAKSLGEHISVDAVTEPYATTYGVAVRTENLDRSALTVKGIVRGVNATVQPPEDGANRQLRESALTVGVLNQTPDLVTLRVELRDAETGEPITLSENPRANPLDAEARNGYIAIAGERVATNSTGVAIVTIDQPGIYTARYEPGSWLDHDPAYIGDTTTVRWHPLGTIEGWFSLFTTTLWQLVPFLLMFYAGHRTLAFLSPSNQ